MEVDISKTRTRLLNRLAQEGLAPSTITAPTRRNTKGYTVTETDSGKFALSIIDNGVRLYVGRYDSERLARRAGPTAVRTLRAQING